MIELNWIAFAYVWDDSYSDCSERLSNVLIDAIVFDISQLLQSSETFCNYLKHALRYFLIVCYCTRAIHQNVAQPPKRNMFKKREKTEQNKQHDTTLTSAAELRSQAKHKTNHSKR